MSNPALPQPGQVVGPGVAPAKPFLDALFGGFWPEQSVPPAPRLVVAALVAGLVAALVLPFRAPGIGTFLVLVVVAAVVAAADRRLRTPYHLAAAGLCLLLVSTVFVRDAAWIVNPLAGRNQIEGAVVMGIGMALFEHTHYDPQFGAPINSNLADYMVAVNADIPPIDVHFLDFPDKEINELGARGIGEIGLAGIAAAITAAVHHATGVRVRELPVKIEHLLA